MRKRDIEKFLAQEIPLRIEQKPNLKGCEQEIIAAMLNLVRIDEENQVAFIAGVSFAKTEERLVEEVRDEVDDEVDDESSSLPLFFETEVQITVAYDELNNLLDAIDRNNIFESLCAKANQYYQELFNKIVKLPPEYNADNRLEFESVISELFNTANNIGSLSNFIDNHPDFLRLLISVAKRFENNPLKARAIYIINQIMESRSEYFIHHSQEVLSFLIETCDKIASSEQLQPHPYLAHQVCLAIDTLLTRPNLFGGFEDPMQKLLPCLGVILNKANYLYKHEEPICKDILELASISIGKIVQNVDIDEENCLRILDVLFFAANQSIYQEFALQNIMLAIREVILSKSNSGFDPCQSKNFELFLSIANEKECVIGQNRALRAEFAIFLNYLYNKLWHDGVSNESESLVINAMLKTYGFCDDEDVNEKNNLSRIILNLLLADDNKNNFLDFLFYGGNLATLESMSEHTDVEQLLLQILDFSREVDRSFLNETYIAEKVANFFIEVAISYPHIVEQSDIFEIIFAIEENEDLIINPRLKVAQAFCSEFSRFQMIRLNSIIEKYPDQDFSSLQLLLARFLTENLESRGEEEFVCGCVDPMLWALENDQAKIYIEDICNKASEYLEACVNQPIAGVVRISFMCMAIKQRGLLQKIEAIKAIEVFNYIVGSIETNNAFGRELKVEAFNAMLQIIHFQLLQDGIIKEPWPSIAISGNFDNIPYSQAVVDSVQENFQEYYLAILQIMNKDNLTSIQQAFDTNEAEFIAKVLAPKLFEALQREFQPRKKELEFAIEVKDIEDDAEAQHAISDHFEGEQAIIDKFNDEFSAISVEDISEKFNALENETRFQLISAARKEAADAISFFENAEQFAVASTQYLESIESKKVPKTKARVVGGDNFFSAEKNIDDFVRGL